MHIAIEVFYFRPVINRWVQYNLLLGQRGVWVPFFVISRTISVEISSMTISISVCFAVITPPWCVISLRLSLVVLATGRIAVPRLQLKEAFFFAGYLTGVRHEGGLPMVEGRAVTYFRQDSWFGRVLCLA